LYDKVVTGGMIIFDALCLVEAAEAIKDWMTEKGLSYKVFNPYNDEEYEIIKRTGFPTEITRNHVNLDSQSGLHIGSYIIKKNMISLIIPTYRNPEYLDIYPKSAIEQQTNINEIIVAVDGFIEESQDILDKYKDDISVLDLVQNQGMQQALSLGVMNATNKIILIVNDDNVFCMGWDIAIIESLKDKNQYLL
jgi:hypothetical protein